MQNLKQMKAVVPFLPGNLKLHSPLVAANSVTDISPETESLGF